MKQSPNLRPGPTALRARKLYIDIPFAHRQPNHQGHCRYIHGHNWNFAFTFAATQLDECGFVVDFGRLTFIKEWLNRTFDHALVLNASDPLLPKIRKFVRSIGLDNVVVVDDCSCEGLAVHVFAVVDDMVRKRFGGRVILDSVEVLEDSKNGVLL